MSRTTTEYSFTFSILLPQLELSYKAGPSVKGRASGSDEACKLLLACLSSPILLECLSCSRGVVSKQARRLPFLSGRGRKGLLRSKWKAIRGSAGHRLSGTRLSSEIKKRSKSATVMVRGSCCCPASRAGPLSLPRIDPQTATKTACTQRGC
jgi:hypothetical protein